MSVNRHILVAAISALVLVPAPRAWGAEPTKAECIAASEEGQELQHAGRLRAAREKLAICVAASCPGPVREDCSDRVREIDESAPTIVFDVKDSAGKDLSAVSVSVDGEPVARKLDGTAFVVDPGEHVFKFEFEGLTPLEKRIVVHEGEKNRRERVSFATPLKRNGSSEEGPSLRVPAYIAFGVGGVGLVVGIVFSAIWVTDKSNGDNACGSGCTQDVKDTWTSKQNADTVGIVVGFVAAGLGTGLGATLLLLNRSTPPKTDATRLRMKLGFGSVGVEGRF